MPNYTYLCQCGYKLDVSHSIHITPEYLCPTCKLVMLRVPQVASVQFKSGGFYSTDKKS
jgi:predicted nucleic acid-binding Zn ribbon protein